MQVKCLDRSWFLVQSGLVNFMGLIVVLLFMTKVTWAQVSRTSFITKETAMAKARKYGFKLQRDDERPPTVKLDSARKVWIVSKSETRHMSRGPCSINQPQSDSCDCSKTKGCTEVRTREIRINALTGKLLRLKTFRKRFPNYE